MSRKTNTASISRPFLPVNRDEGAVFQGIVEQISERLRDGTCRPGDLLPGEREMAAQLQVSRNSLRSALAALTVMGVLETRPGSGTRISPDGSRVLEHAFTFLILLDWPDYAHIHQAREAIEVHLAGEAALRRTEEDLAVIREALREAHEAAAQTPQNLFRMGNANYAFHLSVAAAAHNPVLERVLACLHAARRAFFLSITTQGSGRPEYNEVHERLYEAIQDRDADAARRAMAMDMSISLDVLEFIRRRDIAEGDDTSTPQENPSPAALR